ncbi:MAG: virulence-associated E family protein, partial [Bacteroides sp.]|nr:virulence-associated E family protein [Bacteroides sp.]
RQCVFFGTTNERFFLKDETGNRRFPIIPIKPELRKHGNEWFNELKGERDQLWAEAYSLWKQDYKLFLPEEMETMARERQQEYTDGSDDPMLGVLQAFLDTKLPPDWATWELARRRAWMRNPDPLDATGTVLRDRVCVPEFICERMGRDMTDKEYKYIARKVAALMDKLGWTRLATTRHAVTLYGVQRGFRRPEKDSPDAEII